MDTLFWKQCCPDISLAFTTHLSYGQYAYRLVLKVHGSTMLRHHDDFNTQMDGRHRQVNYGGSWRTWRQPSRQDICVLENLRSYRSDLPDGVRVRIEEPYIQFYASDEQKLKTLVQTIFVQVPASAYLESITAPKCQKDLELLTEGFVLCRKKDYAFRMHIRDGRYHKTVRDQLLTLLDAQQEQVRMPPRTRDHLVSDRSDYLWGCYFWCQDDSLRLLVDMMWPRTIRHIDKFLDPAEDK